MKINEYGGPKISRDAYLKAKPKPVQMEKGETAALIKKSHSKRGAPGTLKRKVKGKMTLAKARALKNRPGATTMDKKQANFFINMHSESVDWVCGKCSCDPCTCGEITEDAAAMNTGAIPNPAQTAMGPSRLPTNIFRRKMGLPINVTDRRRKKDKPPKMRKKFRDFRNG